MFSWIYIYIFLGLVLIGVLFWLWSSVKGWWYGYQTNKEVDKSYLDDIFQIEVNNHHLFRLYAIELNHEIESYSTTLNMIQENFVKIQQIWEKILEKEHYIVFIDLLRKKMNTLISIIEEDVGTVKSTKKILRKINRKISEIHEDWWGLRFDGSNYMKLLNEMDMNFLNQTLKIQQNHSEQTKDSFQNILLIQHDIEKIIKNKKI